MTAESLEEKVKKAITDFNLFDAGLWNVSPELVAKKHWKRERALKEMRMGRFLEQNNVSVPGNYHVVQIPDEHGLISDLSDSYLVMRKIENAESICEFYEWDDERYLNATNLFKQELGKVLDLKILPKDCFFRRNHLYVPEKNKVYLIDFEFWKFAETKDDVQDMNDCRNFLEEEDPKHLWDW